jgi:hypothetical protein
LVRANAECRIQNAESPGNSEFCILNSEFSLARNRVVAAPHYSSDETAIRSAWPAQADTLDLLEPFARIREALEEAQKSVRVAA